MTPRFCGAFGKASSRGLHIIPKLFSPRSSPGKMNYVTEVLVTGFQLLESRAQRAMRENNAGQDLADLVLEEEELPF